MEKADPTKAQPPKLRLAAISYPGFEPWDLEHAIAEELGASWMLLPYSEFCARPVDCDVLINGGGWPLPAELLDQMPSCRFIVSFGIGMDWIDIDDATRRGILLARTPTVNVEDVATHAMALILACGRRLLETDTAIRKGGFPSVIRPIHRFRDRRLGLLSFGNIPRRLAALVAELGLRVSAHDPGVDDATIRSHGVEPVAFEELLRSSDILSVHTPATSATEGLLDASHLRQLPRGAILVVTSRGAVYDAAAVRALLESGHLAAAGLDVFPEEPIPPGDPILSAPRTVLTPHIAGYSEEAVGGYHDTAVRAVVDFVNGRVPAAIVNEAAVEAAGLEVLR